MSKTKHAASPAKPEKQRKQSPGGIFARLNALPPALVLTAAFILSVLIRHLLNLATTNGPVIYIDEGLYINLARGLAFDKALTYRAMPTSYAYLVYPAVLMPLMHLPASMNLYRAVQLYNALLMASAVFPAYLLARRMDFDRSRSYLVCLFVLLIPDMALSGFLMCECLLYPLFMWLAYCGWRLICHEKPFFFGALCALLTTLLYFTKPGYIVFGTVLLVYLLIRSLHTRRVQDILQAVPPLILLAALLFGAYAIYRTTLDGASTLLTHYDKQIPVFSATNVLVAIQAVLLHMLAFAAAGAGILLPISLCVRRRSPDSHRILADITLLSLLCSTIGTAVMVSLYEWTGTWLCDRTHLRYLMCYAPLLFMLLLSPTLDGFKTSRRQHTALALLALLLIFPGGMACFTAASGTADSAALSLMYAQKLGIPLAVMSAVLIAGFVCWLRSVLHKRGFTPAVRQSCVVMLAAFMLANNFAFYALRSGNKIKGDVDIEAEAQALAEMIDGESPLMITTNLYNNFRGYQSDAHLHRPVQYVVSNNLLLELLETGGVYRPFVPVTQAPNTNNLETIDTDLLICDITVADYLEFADSVQLQTTPGGLYTLARIQKNQPLLKTAISGMNGFTLSPDTTGSLIVYDDALVSRGNLTLHIWMRSTAASDTVVFTAGDQRFPIEITNKMQQYSVDLPVTGCGFFNISFTSQNSLIINEYHTE